MPERDTGGWLSIGDLADRTGLRPATIRMWEARHGFPQPRRLESGHRRYGEAEVRAVADVVRRRSAGVRLDVAIAEASRAAEVARTEPGHPSVFAELRRTHSGLAVHRLRKSTLLALSWAIEDECCARARCPTLFAGFQREQFFSSSRSRWVELARTARLAVVFANFPVVDDATPLVRVPLPHDSPMRREWMVVCDAPDAAAALSAWELPGQDRVPDLERVFEAMWTVDPAAVRDAARVCARVAATAGFVPARRVLTGLADPAPTADLATTSAMFGRVVAYVDRLRSA